MHFYSLPYVPHAPPISSCSAYPNTIWWKLQTWSSSFCIYLQFPVIYSLSGPNIFHITLLSHTFKPMSPLNWTTQISHTYKTCKIIVLCILITMFLESKREGKGRVYHVTAHKPTCHNLQAGRVELNIAASSEGCCFCWQKINQNNTRSLRLFRSAAFRCIFQTTFKIFALTQNSAHTFPRPVKLIPKRQMPHFLWTLFVRSGTWKVRRRRAQLLPPPPRPAEFITYPVAAHFKMLQKIQVRKTNLLLLKWPSSFGFVHRRFGGTADLQFQGGWIWYRWMLKWQVRRLCLQNRHRLIATQTLQHTSTPPEDTLPFAAEILRMTTQTENSLA
jgi:hypothetical protein